MTATYKVLAQVAPVATTLTDAYTVPAAKSTVISSVVICNTGTATTFRLAVAVAGAADNIKQYLMRDVSVAGNDSCVLTMGITLATTDVIRVYAQAATLSFNFFGSENT